MKTRIIAMLGLWMVSIMIFVCGRDLNINQDITDMTKLEHYLKTAEILEVEIDSLEGRTAPWAVMLDDGKTARQAIFKYVDRQRPTLLPDSYNYEIAAYKLSKLLKYSAVPPVVEREIKDTIGSLHLFLEGCFPLNQKQRKGIEPVNAKKFSDDLSTIAVFENLVFCERNPEDIFIQESDWKIWRVDFSEAFSPAAELFHENDITKCSRTLFLNLKNVDQRVIEGQLQKHLNEEELDTLFKRKDLIIDKITLLIEAKGEDAVLF
ncbi:MAG: hypothetical protein PVI66_13840 [Candidatus Aminicenantes bacterium]